MICRTHCRDMASKSESGQAPAQGVEDLEHIGSCVDLYTEALNQGFGYFREELIEALPVLVE